MKNMDPLNDDVVQLLANSNEWFVPTLWMDTANVIDIGLQAQSVAKSVFGGERPRKRMFRTMGLLYKEQLANLMSVLC